MGVDGIDADGYVTVCTAGGGTAFAPSNCDMNTPGVRVVAGGGVASARGGVAPWRTVTAGRCAIGVLID